ncbi:MAG: excinuclease ABC subunit UvrC, partial [Bdellovibrionota bacterium]
IEQHSLKTKALVEKVYDYEIIVTESEYESLLLENNLIKHNLPPYNILLRDDKTFPYIKIDKSESWPRITITRRRKKDGCLYFGPYTIAGQMQQILNVINRFFPLIKCTPTVFKTVTRPCNYYDIKKCLGPCKLPVDKNVYNAHLENVIGILNGDTAAIAKKIKEEMHQAALGLDYEKAALLRDQFKSLINLSKNQSVTLDIPLFLDTISFFWSTDMVVFYISFIRNGILVGGNSIIVKDMIHEPEGNAQESICSSFICQYYSKKEIPDFIFLSQAQNLFSEQNFTNINQYLRTLNSNAVLYKSNTEFLKNLKSVYKINKIGEYNKVLNDIINLSVKNAENKFQEQIKIDESSLILMEDLKNILQLDFLPRYIECFDISTFQGAQTVASQVAFKDGLTYKSGYKKYIIKENVGKTDDFASLREVMRRRFKHRDKLPDLVVIDGGTPQIREVGWTLKSLGLEHLHFIGLAKSRVQNTFHDVDVTSSQERIIIPKRSENGELLPAEPCFTVVLKEGSPAFRLLTQLRDEAHRFAIQFHRSKRDKASLKSVILELKGLGSKRRKQLLDACPDLKELVTMNLNELAKKTKIPLNILLELRERIREIHSP